MKDSAVSTFESAVSAALPVTFERRRYADRRAAWRGGRRDSDWVNKPAAAATQAEPHTTRPSVWRRLFRSD